MLQLNPSIPVDTPKGAGLAILVIQLSEEHNLLWTVIQDETGEIWTWDNIHVRAQKNIQMGRIVDNKYLRGDIKNNEPAPGFGQCLLREEEPLDNLRRMYPAYRIFKKEGDLL